ncbi:hypothetical protein [Streptomyces iakyrus]|uniref:hypothetical protein n=1 Tax=Streptomyces iakyrus TaxID=68219 RepID=UPI003D89D4D6
MDAPPAPLGQEFYMRRVRRYLRGPLPHRGKTSAETDAAPLPHQLQAGDDQAEDQPLAQAAEAGPLSNSPVTASRPGSFGTLSGSSPMRLLQWCGAGLKGSALVGCPVEVDGRVPEIVCRSGGLSLWQMAAFRICCYTPQR